jgi:hypothetical protein
VDFRPDQFEGFHIKLIARSVCVPYFIRVLMGREGCGLLRGFFTILAYYDHLLEECIYSLATADI